MKDDWALVVGINHYPRAGVDPLEGAVHDAKRFYDWVTDPKGGDVPIDVDPNKSHAVLLTSPDPALLGPPQPVFSQIFQFFENLMGKLDNTTGRRLYIYLSGHGISPSGQESVRNAALLMANATAPSPLHCFPGNIWAEGTRSAARFREVVLIMDCCRDLKTNATIIPFVFGEAVADSKDCRLIEAYATDWDSKARELAFPPANQKQGVFTRSLLEVLKAGRMNGTLLKESVKKHLAQALKDEKKAQNPQIGRDEELAKVIFNEQAEDPKTPVSIAGNLAIPPTVEYWPEGGVQSTLVPPETWAKDGALWRGTLTPGQYDLRLPGGGGRRLKVLAGVPEEVAL